MGISSIQRNVSASVGSSKTLVGQYLKVANKDGGNAGPAVLSSPARLVTASDLKDQLLNLAGRLKNFAQSDFSFGSVSIGNGDSSEAVPVTDPEAGEEVPAEPAPEGEASNRVSVSAGGSSKAERKFARQLFKSFREGVEDPNDALMKGRHSSGEVRFEIGDGESALLFSVNVDRNTTAQQFVDEFNSKSQGRAEASLVQRSGNHGHNRYRVQISSTPSAPPVEPPTDGEEGPSTPPPVSDSGLLGSGRLDLSDLQPEAARIAQGLKAFVQAYNSLVRFAEEGNADGNLLSATAVDEEAVGQLRKAIESAGSNDKTVKFGSFIYSRGDKQLAFDEQDFDQAFLEDPEGVSEALRDLADQIGGRNGVVRNFVATGSEIDKAFSSLEVQVATATVDDVNDRSIQQIQEAQRIASKATTSVSALQDKASFLTALRK